ncbi:hypothetical protein METP2_02125 [Methanosarcinales archaeon]|nr:hypothetical protein METP2_02125 [Methanosarcinales archaeon]
MAVGNYVKIQYHILINGINSLIVSLMLDKIEICYYNKSYIVKKYLQAPILFCPGYTGD